ncbi:MAG: hypothetical protein ABSB00_00275 [Minisyncoccia bacterium]|jgi:hypothetical protein
MKKLFFAMVIVVMVLVMYDTVRAEHEAIIGDKTLVKILARHVPPELSTEDAKKLVTGGIREIPIRGKEGLMYSFSFPLIKVKVVYVNKAVSYPNGKWFVDKTMELNEFHNSYGVSILFLWIPILVILGVSIMVPLFHARTRMKSLSYILIAGPFALLFACLFVREDYKSVLQYFLFLFTIVAVSFIIGQLVDVVMETKKALDMADCHKS